MKLRRVRKFAKAVARALDPIMDHMAAGLSDGLTFGFPVMLMFHALRRPDCPMCRDLRAKWETEERMFSCPLV